MTSPSLSSDATIHELSGGALRIGGATTLASLAGDARVTERYPLLARAAVRVAHDTTLGADLARRGFCPYLLQGAPCLKNGGSSCFAVDGDNRLLAILDGGPSWIVHPSDTGVALVALDAIIEVAGAGGARSVAAGDFFVLPSERLDRETVLEDDEHVAGVVIPAASAGGLQRFDDVRDADAGIAVVSLAATRRADGEVRLVLGGVSPRPYRVYNSIEEETNTGRLDEETIEGLADRALLDAEPLSLNGYKVDLAARLLRDAIRALSAEP